MTNTQTTVDLQTLPTETAAPNRDWEDCDACSEVGELCRYHYGVIAGHADVRDAAQATPNMTVADLWASLSSGN